MVDRFIESYPVLFDARASYPVPSIAKRSIASLGLKEGMTTLGENRDEFLYVDKVLFRKELICLMSRYDYVDQITFFKLVHVAYEKAFIKSRIIFH
mgnify:CR=1 FL=1